MNSPMAPSELAAMVERRVIPVAEVRHVANQYSKFTTPSNRERLVLDLAHTTEVKCAQLERVRGLKNILEQLTSNSGGAIAMEAEELTRLTTSHLNDILGDTK